MATDELLSTGAVAQRLGFSASNVVKLEREGVIPKALRLEGSNRRVWRAADVDLIRRQLEERRAARGAAA